MIAFFTIYELEQLNDKKLIKLYNRLYSMLIKSRSGSAERRNILASLDNIDLVRNRRFATKAPSL